MELNVEVIDIQTKSEFEKSQVTVQDRVTDAGKSIFQHQLHDPVRLLVIFRILILSEYRSLQHSAPLE